MKWFNECKEEMRQVWKPEQEQRILWQDQISHWVHRRMKRHLVWIWVRCYDGRKWIIACDWHYERFFFVFVCALKLIMLLWDSPKYCLRNVTVAVTCLWSAVMLCWHVERGHVNIFMLLYLRLWNGFCGCFGYWPKFDGQLVTSSFSSLIHDYLDGVADDGPKWESGSICTVC